MSWGAELWDQYDTIAHHTQRGIEFNEKFTHFLKERCTIELDYARSLKKLVRNFQPRKKEEDEYQFTWAKGFIDMVNELHDVASQHEVVAENLQGNVMKDMQNLIAELKQERKRLLNEGQKIQEQLNKSYQHLDRAKNRYEKGFKEAEKTMESYRKADADINLSRAEVEKTRMLMNTKAQLCEECKNEYAAQLLTTNQHQSNFYTSLMPEVFQQLQQMDEKRINRLKDFIHQCADVEANVIPIINTCIDGMKKAANNIDANNDSRLVIDRNKSGFPKPDDIPFEDLSLGQSIENSNNVTPKNTIDHKNTSKLATLSGKSKKRTGLFGLFGSSKVPMKIIGLLTDDQKEDFSDLPPNQRRRKLTQKIDSIKKEMAKESAEREGMLKMKDVYCNNPALGDPTTLDKKVEENAQKIDGLRQELQKFEGYLSDAENNSSRGRDKRNSTSDDSISMTASESSVIQRQDNSLPGTPQTQHNVTNVPVDGDVDDEEDEFNYPVIGTCRALYRFEAVNEGSVPMDENEEMFIIEQDQGDGWTRIRKDDNIEGFVPTSYLQCHLYEVDQV
ncbi:formin-binding protein 1 isoform X2 [Patella vulgata]|uniref:formin-binding protein 1 isoform X2 n=1 Tax=Patella vulgata TaxID=6465 RepID=UPI00217F9D7B|nr:formin-binding protein 1 isoform X2 [Patella vulgata]